MIERARVSVSRSIFAIVDDRDRMYFGRSGRDGDQIGFIDENTRAIFGRSYAAEPDVLVEELRRDEGRRRGRHAAPHHPQPARRRLLRPRHRVDPPPGRAGARLALTGRWRRLRRRRSRRSFMKSTLLTHRDYRGLRGIEAWRGSARASPRRGRRAGPRRYICADESGEDEDELRVAVVEHQLDLPPRPAEVGVDRPDFVYRCRGGGPRFYLGEDFGIGRLQGLVIGAARDGLLGLRPWSRKAHLSCLPPGPATARVVDSKYVRRRFRGPSKALKRIPRSAATQANAICTFIDCDLSPASAKARPASATGTVWLRSGDRSMRAFPRSIRPQGRTPCRNGSCREG